MNKLKAKPVTNNKGTFYVEVDTGEEKLLVGNGEIIAYTEFETEEEAIEWIESKDKLELNI